MKPALQACPAHPQESHRDTDGPHLLTQVQVCARLGISDRTWIRWRKAHLTPAAVVLPSGRLKWRVSDIEALGGRHVEAPRRFFQAVARRERHTPQSQPYPVIAKGRTS